MIFIFIMAFLAKSSVYCVRKPLSKFRHFIERYINYSNQKNLDSKKKTFHSLYTLIGILNIISVIVD